MATVQTPSIALTIQIAWASMVYAGRDIRKKAYRQNETNKDLAKQLAFATLMLEWNYENDNPGNYDLKLIRNYVLMLCGQYIVEAQTNIGSGGIVITPTNATPFGFEGYREDFTIGQPGSLMNAGDQVLTINLPGFIRNTVMIYPSGINLTIGNDPNAFEVTSIVYTSTSVTITLDQPVVNGQRYIVTGLRYAAATSVPSGGGTTLPTQTGHEGEVLFTDGAGNLYWGDVLIEVTSTDFELDGVTLNDTRMLHNKMAIYWMQGGAWLDSTQFVRISSGGFTITIPGFNATTMQSDFKVLLKGLNS